MSDLLKAIGFKNKPGGWGKALSLADDVRLMRKGFDNGFKFALDELEKWVRERFITKKMTLKKINSMREKK